MKKKSSTGQYRNLKHYEYISNFRQNLRDAVVALSIKNKINYFPRYDLTYISRQCKNHEKYLLTKQDKSLYEHFKLKLKDKPNAIKASKNNAYIMSDLNYDLLQHSHAFKDDFVDTMYDHFFIQL